MPEGPEVLRVVGGLALITNQTIKSAYVLSGRYSRAAPASLAQLDGAQLKRITCKGKLIIFHLQDSNGPFAVLSTLGMTGWWALNSGAHRHARIKIVLDNDQELVFTDVRNFGTFKVVSYQEMRRKVAELGPDILTLPPLWHSVTLPHFFERVAKYGKKQTLAEGLLDQRIAAGCGNYIRADAMWLARFSPHRPISEMSPVELKLMWRALYEIGTAATLDLRPPTFLDADPHEQSAVQGYQNLVYGQKQSHFGGVVQSFSDKHGRTVWWSPREQEQGSIK